MNWSTSVLTTVSSDTEPSIIVTFDNAKYIFNTSENTTRSFLQSGRTWKRARALFFTQARVEKTSGLPGMSLKLERGDTLLKCSSRSYHDFRRCNDQ